MWIKGRTDLSPLTYREWREGMDMIEGGSISKGKHTFYAPFTIREEEIPNGKRPHKALTPVKYHKRSTADD